MMRDRILAWLTDNVPDSRLQHILRVEEMSAQLAAIHNLDVAKAAQAGLMHDLAKYFKSQRLLTIARAEGLELDPVVQANPHLLHAEVGAIVARETFGIKDEEILQAIANHTLGRPNMDLLSCTVFLADSLEPGRGDTPELEALRHKSRQNIYQAVWQTCDYALKYLVERHLLIHPRMILTRNWAIQVDKHSQQVAQTNRNPLSANAG